jgi:DNA polymerase
MPACAGNGVSMQAREAKEALRWLVDAGADEAVAEAGVDRTQPAPATSPPPPRAAASRPSEPAAPSVPGPVEALSGRAAVESTAGTATLGQLSQLAELEAAVRAFNGCALKLTATNTVFADGHAQAPLMLIGEAPGADEDRLGRPFVGASGQLLDRMLAAIGLDRHASLPERAAYITNILFWRPPGNRQPTLAEIEQCRPFLDRHIELKRPKLIVVLGGSAAKTLLGLSEGIVRLRGRWFNYRTTLLRMEIPVLATYHPAYLLRSPGQKRDAWRDFIALKTKLSEGL